VRRWSIPVVGFAVFTVAIGQGGQRGQQRGGPPAVFRTEVPESSINVIAGAPTETSVHLSILCPSNLRVRVVVRTKAGDIDSKLDRSPLQLVANTPYDLILSDLRPSSIYDYELRDAITDSKLLGGRFATAKKTGQSFVFDIQADSHLDGNTDPKVYQNTLQNVVADQPDFLVDLGDTFMVDKYPNYLDSRKQYQAQRFWLSIPGSMSSIFLCLGNHDGEYGWRSRGGEEITPWSRSQRQFYFPTIQPNGFYSGAPKVGLYYSWQWGDALCVVLDPFVATRYKPRSAEEGWNWTLGETQFKWLKQTLRASSAKYKFLFIHHLVGGFGKEARGGVEASDKFEWGDPGEFPAQRTGWAEPIHSLMVKYKVSALFHGHDHLYVRQSRDGIAYLEVPQPSQARGDNTRSAEEYGYKTGKLLGSSGHIRVTVSPTEAKLEYVKSRLYAANREVVDSFSIAPSK